MSDQPSLPAYLPDQPRVDRLAAGQPKDPVTVDKPVAVQKPSRPVTKVRVGKTKAPRRKNPFARPRDPRRVTYY